MSFPGGGRHAYHHRGRSEKPGLRYANVAIAGFISCAIRIQKSQGLDLGTLHGRMPQLAINSEPMPKVAVGSIGDLE